MSNVVFHYTDSFRLPWIAETGELRPGLNRVSGLPYDFLWATTNAAGDRTCSAQGTLQAREAYRRGLSQLVRFTLPSYAFDKWRDVSRLYPEWTPEQVARTEQLAIERHNETGFDNWRMRRDPFPLGDIISIDTKAFTSGRWVPICPKMKLVKISDVEDACGVIIDEHVYMSRKIVLPNGPVGYVPMGVTPADRLKTLGRV